MFKVHLSKSAMKSLGNTTGYLLAESISWSDKFRTYSVRTMDKKNYFLAGDSITLYYKVENENFMVDENGKVTILTNDSTISKTWLEQVKMLNKDKKVVFKVVPTQYFNGIQLYIDGELISTNRVHKKSHIYPINVIDSLQVFLISIGFDESKMEIDMSEYNKEEADETNEVLVFQTIRGKSLNSREDIFDVYILDKSNGKYHAVLYNVDKSKGRHQIELTVTLLKELGINAKGFVTQTDIPARIVFSSDRVIIMKSNNGYEIVSILNDKQHKLEAFEHAEDAFKRIKKLSELVSKINSSIKFDTNITYLDNELTTYIKHL